MMTFNLYEQIEAKQRTGYNRTCINGSVTGCGKCVGYCQYDGHPGYLTEQLRKVHKCLEKGCFHYAAKPKRVKVSRKETQNLDALLSSAIQRTAQMEGLRIMSIQEQGPYHWQLNYVAISNEYPIQKIAYGLENDFHGKVSFAKLNYYSIALIIK